MPNGLKFVLPMTVSDSSFSILRDDSVLTPGTLLLVDFAHSMNPAAGYVNAASGVPADNALAYNLAFKEAAALIGGSPTASDIAATIYNQGLSGSSGKIERTPKGGIHTIFAQTGVVNASTVGFKVSVKQKLLDYLYANYDHKMFFSFWFNETRMNNAGISNGPVYSLFGKLSGGSTSNFKERFYQGAKTANVAPESEAAGTMLGSRATATPGAALGASNLGMRLSNFGVDLHNASAPTSTSDIGGPLFAVGNSSLGANTGSTAGSVTLNKSGSAVLYRITLEDLTASGRSYAEADAADFAAYTRDVLTAGGRYNGDTLPTNPTTLP